MLTGEAALARAELSAARLRTAVTVEDVVALDVRAVATRTAMTSARTPTAALDPPGAGAFEATPKFKTKPLGSEYVGEHLQPGTWHGEPSRVRYLDATEREAYLITVRDGKLYDASGGAFDTAAATSLHRGGSARAIFVMDGEGNIYASMHHSYGRFHHSSLVAGEPVAAAGEITVENGVLTAISRKSGHYRPSEALLDQVLELLKRRGVRTDHLVKESF